MTDTMEYAETIIEPPIEEGVEPVEEVRQTGGIAYAIPERVLLQLGGDVVDDYERDKGDRSEWEEKAKKALNRAAQESLEQKNFPWVGAANVSYPLLTVAALQFQARAYPALVKNDEAVQIKVFGSIPELDPAVEQIAAQAGNEQLKQAPLELQQGVQEAVQMMQAYKASKDQRAAKKARAKRVADYLNYQIFYEMPEWESDTDAMLLALPIVGAAFRKTFVDPDTGKVRSAYVPAMNVIVPQSATSLVTTPRVTEEMCDVYPYQIKSRMLTGVYLDQDILDTGEDEQQGRLLLEQYRFADLDEDGLEEPYIITVDKDSAKVLRIEPGWLNQHTDDQQVVTGHDRYMPYTLYSFIPDPKGRFYPIGFGHLLDPISDIVNTTINQMLDAGTAQIAGGGFISGGLRLQGSGQTNKLQFRPGEYKVVNAAPGQMQASIYERTFPNPSAVAFQMLEMMLGAAKDISGTSDVITGQAPSTAPVGTTMALIEQGLQQFTAIYKRIFRAGKNEYRMLYDMIARFGSAEDYAEVTDDYQGDFAKDFSLSGKDVMPVSDPTVSTKMQEAAKGSFLLGERGKGGNDRELSLAGFRALGIDSPEMYWPQPAPPPGFEEAQAVAKATAEAEINVKKSTAAKNLAATQKTMREAQQTALENGLAQAEIDAILGGVPAMANLTTDAMGGGSIEQGSQSPV